MKILNLKFYLHLLFICMFIGFTNCTEEQIIPEQDNTISESRSSKAPSTHSITTTAISDIVYVRWDPKVLDPRKDQIRATYADVNGYMYLESYTICPNDPYVEIWQVSFNLLVQPPMADQTPDPLSTIPDEDGEMENMTTVDICSLINTN